MNSVGLVCLVSPSGVIVFPVSSCVSEWLVLQLSICIFHFLIYFNFHVLSSFKNKFNSIQFNSIHMRVFDVE